MSKLWDFAIAFLWIAGLVLMIVSWFVKIPDVFSYVMLLWSGPAGYAGGVALARLSP